MTNAAYDVTTRHMTSVVRRPSSLLVGQSVVWPGSRLSQATSSPVCYWPIQHIHPGNELSRAVTTAAAAKCHPTDLRLSTTDF